MGIFSYFSQCELIRAKVISDEPKRNFKENLPANCHYPKMDSKESFFL